MRVCEGEMGNELMKRDPLDISFPWATASRLGLIELREPTWEEAEATTGV